MGSQWDRKWEAPRTLANSNETPVRISFTRCLWFCWETCGDRGVAWGYSQRQVTSSVSSATNAVAMGLRQGLFLCEPCSPPRTRGRGRLCRFLSLPNSRMNGSSRVLLSPLAATSMQPVYEPTSMTLPLRPDLTLVARDIKMNKTRVLPSKNIQSRGRRIPKGITSINCALSMRQAPG